MRKLYGVPNVRLENVGHIPLHGEAVAKLNKVVMSFSRGYPSTLGSAARNTSSIDWEPLIRRYPTTFHRESSADAIGALYTEILCRYPPVAAETLLELGRGCPDDKVIV